jgi:protein-tyrosine phosphatase
VLNVGREVKDHPLPDINYKLRFFEDADPYPCEAIWECVQWIDARIREDHTVYVHCMQGNSRSASTIIAYLQYKGMDFAEACNLIMRIKPFYTHEGKVGPMPLAIRPWFERDWPVYVRQLGSQWPAAAPRSE